MPTRNTRQRQWPQLLRVGQGLGSGNQRGNPAVDRRTQPIRIADFGQRNIIDHQHERLGDQVSLRLQGQFKQGMAEYVDCDPFSPSGTLAPEQRIPVMSVPKFDQVRITANDDRAGLVEMGHRTLGACALARPNPGDIAALGLIQGTLDARPAEPDQRIEQVVPVAFAGRDLTVADALFIVQAIGKQARRLGHERRSLDSIGHCGRTAQLIEGGDGGPIRAPEQGSESGSPVGQRRPLEIGRINRIDGGNDQAQGLPALQKFSITLRTLVQDTGRPLE